MLTAILKSLSGGNSRPEWLLLEEARSGSLTVARLDDLLSLRADINTITIKEAGLEGYTPLMHYVCSPNPRIEVVEHFMRRGANSRARSSYGHTALSMVWYGSRNAATRMKLVELLVRNGADVNSENSSGYTPLHNACGNGTEAEIGNLLDVGAVISIDKLGKSTGNRYWGFAPLHTAIYEARRVQEPRAPIVTVLLKAGADPNRPSNHPRGYTPLMLVNEGLSDIEHALGQSDTNASRRDELVKWRADLHAMQTLLR